MEFMDIHIFSKSRRPFEISSSFDKFIMELRERYKGFFEEVETGLDSHELIVEPIANEEVGERYADETLRKVEELGIETIAVYIPYHLSRDWGIYVFVEMLNGLSKLISKRLSMRFRDAFACCERAVLEHESFHFQTEYAATCIETINTKPSYLPYFERSRPYSLDEEAIANAWMLTSS